MRVNNCRDLRSAGRDRACGGASEEPGGGGERDQQALRTRAGNLDELPAAFDVCRQFGRETVSGLVHQCALAMSGADVKHAIDDAVTGFELGDTRGIAVSLKNLGLLAHYRGDDLEATRLLEESLRLRRMIGDRYGIAVAVSALAEVARQQGDVDRALDLYREAIEARRRLKINAGLPDCLFGLAAIAESRGDHLRAARLVGASDALRDQLGQAIPPVASDGYDCTIATIQTHLSPEEVGLAREAGRRLGLEQAIAETLNVYTATRH